MNSKQKGKRGELEWASECRDNGFDARRGQQFSGTPDSPDVVSKDLHHFHFEVKRVQHLNLTDAMVQAVGDAGDKMPVVASRRNNAPWLVTMRAEDWFALVREWITSFEQPNQTAVKIPRPPLLPASDRNTPTA